MRCRQQHLFWNQKYSSIPQFQMHAEVQDLCPVIWNIFLGKSYVKSRVYENTNSVPKTFDYYLCIVQFRLLMEVWFIILFLFTGFLHGPQFACQSCLTQETYASIKYNETIIPHNPAHQFIPPLGAQCDISP